MTTADEDPIDRAERLYAENLDTQKDIGVGKAILSPQERLLADGPTFPDTPTFSNAWVDRRRVRKAALMALPHTTDSHMPIPPIRAKNHVCPRCRGPVPNLVNKGVYSGAISRTDNATEVCSLCGNDEGDEDKFDRLVPQSSWPIPSRTKPVIDLPSSMISGPATTMLAPGEVADVFQVGTSAPPLTQKVDLRVGTRNWKDGGPHRKPWCPEKMPDLRHNLMDGWAKLWPYPFDAAASVALLDNASLWWIGDEMCDLLYSTLAAIPADTKVENLTIPSEFGLVYFVKEWRGIAAETGERTAVINAITWATGLVGPNEEPCLSVQSYRYIDLGLMDWQDSQMAKNLGLLDLAKAQTLGVTTKLKEIKGRMERVCEGGAWAPLGRSDWPLSEQLDSPSAKYTMGESPYGPRIGTDTFDLSAQEDRRVISALFTLVNTASLTRVEESKPSRQVVKQAKKRGERIPSTVKVVYLRRPSRPRKPGEASEGGHLSHRFPVRAHPRMQAYGPHHSLRRLIMVKGYVKGPQDKPFVAKETVNAWVR